MDRAQRYAQKKKRRGGGFFPAQVSAIKAWLRLAASTAVSAEWETVVDVLNSNPAAQTDADRKPAAATSANSLPVATFDGTDVWVWPIAASNHSTDKWEILLWIKPASLGAAQRVFACDTSGGASLNRIRVTISATGTVDVLVFISNADGRQFSTPAVISAASWAFIRVAYNSSATNEADTDGLTADAKVRVFVGGAARALTGANVGAGGTIGALRTATGSNVVGAANDSDTPVSPLLNGGQTGPNIWIANAVLTTAEATNLQSFEAPT
jgi:hypothetical protein